MLYTFFPATFAHYGRRWRVQKGLTATRATFRLHVILRRLAGIPFTDKTDRAATRLNGRYAARDILRERALQTRAKDSRAGTTRARNGCINNALMMFHSLQGLLSRSTNVLHNADYPVSLLFTPLLSRSVGHDWDATATNASAISAYR
jgi:hypothetical protein